MLPMTFTARRLRQVHHPERLPRPRDTSVRTRSLSNNNQRNWEMMALSAVGRYHFVTDGRSWNPYLAFGLGGQEAP